jgi:CBS domain-containing protein
MLQSARLLPVARVCEVMTRHPITCSFSALVVEAQSRALADALHHLPVLGPKGELLGLVCLCDLQRAKPTDSVSSCMSSPVLTVSAHTPLPDAAGLMREHGVGCLVVTSSGGHLMGVVTRRDLRDAGVLAREPGLDACAACGSTHGLVGAIEVDDPVFCNDCIERGGGWMFEFYDTLGGGG